ncbi:Rad52/Rad22 family DNA repair protein [Pseudoalteromonas sp. S16_S37]|uniref:Rad52/Rad22 family DNA repair protein n=1 Tax=Pseudoalteromonas sp. S16_S37 TaxID=2720228 RepID=UPI00168172C5|nr:Rad52/Rad22 family DNA repair protein [Pseudoalteromonas sp. S16_S37]MBD1583462.1 hypothetical protein [Pseudoalteromonas sp. S16_S37]
MNIQEIQKQLSDPFEEHEIEWMVQRCGINHTGPWVQVVPYVTNRAVQQRLDDVLGLNGWENLPRDTPHGQICGLKLKLGDQTITKWDGADYQGNHGYEPLKSALSGSMKRAAVQFGIARYLYSIEPVFMQCQPLSDGKECTANYIEIKSSTGVPVSAQWEAPALPAWALPRAKFDSYLDAIKSAETLTALKAALIEAVKVADVHNRSDIKEQAQALRDSRLFELEELSEQKRKESLARFNKWLNSTIQELEETENESILERKFKAAMNELRGQCLALTLNKVEYENRLNQVKHQRISQLQGAH